MNKIRFLASAREDLRQAKAYYRRINPELARRFQIELEHALELMNDQPKAMQEVGAGIRRWPLEVFPHGILYRVESDCLLVLAIFHPSREPPQPLV